MKLRESIQRLMGMSANATLRKACVYGGISLAAVLLAAFVPAISANAQSSQGGSSQDSSQAASQSAAAAQSDSTTPAMQNASAPPPQSLGDAARAANAQKQQTKAKHVYTDEDVSSIGGRISVVGDGNSSADGDANANGDADGQGAAPSAGAQDEKYWRGRANQIKNAIADVDRQIEDKKAEIAKAGATSFDPSAGLSQGVIIIHDRNAELKDLEDRKASLENQLDQLADEGRKAGADSGWFR